MKIDRFIVESRVATVAEEFGFTCYYTVDPMGNKNFCYYKSVKDCYVILENICQKDHGSNRVRYSTIKFYAYNKYFTHYYLNYLIKAGFTSMDINPVLNSSCISMYSYKDQFECFIDNEMDLERVCGIVKEILSEDLDRIIEENNDLEGIINFVRLKDINTVHSRINDKSKILPMLFATFDKDYVKQRKEDWLNNIKIYKFDPTDKRLGNLYDLLLDNNYTLEKLALPEKDYSKPKSWFIDRVFHTCPNVKEIASMSGKINTHSINEKFYSLYILEDINEILYNTFIKHAKPNKKFLAELVEMQEGVWLGKFNQKTILVGNHTDNELVLAIKPEQESEISDVILTLDTEGKGLFVHMYQSYNLISYVIENGKKRIRMMYIHPTQTEMEGEFNEEEKAIILENEGYTRIEKIFNYHLKLMTGLENINDRRFGEILMTEVI